MEFVHIKFVFCGLQDSKKVMRQQGSFHFSSWNTKDFGEKFS